jgi:hypothetical protein
MKHLTSSRRSTIATFVLIYTFAIGASATTPKKTTSEFSFDIPGFIQCTYGALDASLSITDYRIFFYDASGSLTRVHDRNVITTVVTNPLNGKSGSGITVGTQISPFLDGQQVSGISQGVGFRLVVGGRQLPIAAGRLIFNASNFETIFQTPHAVFTADIQAALCNALQ